MKWAIPLTLAGLAAIAWLAIPPGIMPVLGSASPPDAAATRARLAALARSQVFANAGTDRPDPVAGDIECRYLDRPVSGTTAKFDCTLADGARLRVKYGWTEEIHAEVATAHLLAALGFGADDVVMARRVRCQGCPHWPMFARQAAGRLHLETVLLKQIDYERHTDFEWVSVERRRGSSELKFDGQEGWSWDELSAIDPAQGGATRAEVDAFRLMAMFLNHWDNKPSNQRLTCPATSSTDADAPECDHPLAMIQDVGSTFGPKKVNRQAWNASPLWADATSCTISMKHLPYHGSTFSDISVSEEGRRLLADRLLQLTRPQVTALFTSARFDEVDQWVAAFERRVDLIARRPPCPSRAS